MNHNTQRIVILIDEVNLYLTAKRLYGSGKIDYQVMLNRFNHRNIIRAIAYCVETPENDVTAFKRNVGRYGVEVKSKAVKVFSNGKRKGDWDVGIAVQAIQLAEKVDVITLVTGDGDFMPLVNYLKHLGIKVELMAFQKRVSGDLLKCVDEFIPIPADMVIKKS